MINTDKLWMVDAHCDSLWMRDFLHDTINLDKSKFKLPAETRDFFKKTLNFSFPENYSHNYHINISRLKKGNIKVLFMNLGDYDLLQSSRLIDAAYELTKENNFAICRDYSEVMRAIKNDQFAIIISAEGPCIFNGQIDLLRNWHRLGLKMVSVAHGEGTQGLPENPKRYFGKKSVEMAKNALQISTSLEKHMSVLNRHKLYKKEKGLTLFGKQVINEMTKLNMICDLSHANDASFWQVLESNVKVSVTHSNCFSVCNHTRNLTDEMMKALAQRNGVMGICFYGDYIDINNPTLDKFTDHIFHALSIIGEDHVGIGSDYDGVPPDAFMAVKQPGFMSKLWENLIQRGLSEKILLKIAHENFLKLLK